jgi:hypothetical protein
MPGSRSGRACSRPARRIFSYNEFTSLQQVKDVLSRYTDHFRTGNLKEYRTGNRRVRQWVAMARRNSACSRRPRARST